MKAIKRGFLVVILAGLAAYAGACVWANFVAGDGQVKAPAIEKARYAIQIESTRQVLFSDKVTDGGNLVTLAGYYEFNGKRYLWRKQTLAMDESLFGPITVVKRQAQ